METGEKEKSYRSKLKNTAKMFKTNWVLFGEYLTRVATDRLYQEWGYKCFEDYCREEIRIKKSTAIRLTNAYYFITEEDPELPKEGLDFEAVLALMKVKQSKDCTPEIYQDLKTMAVERKNSAATIAKRFKDHVQAESCDPGKEFQEKNLKLVIQLEKRIKPVDTIPSKYKEYLEEIQEHFESSLLIH